MLHADRNNNMTALQHDELRLTYRRYLVDGTPSQMDGEAFVFTIFGDGVGDALGLGVDKVAAAGIRYGGELMPFFEFLHAPEVAPALAGLPYLRYTFAKVRPDNALVPRFGGLFTIKRSAAAIGVIGRSAGAGGNLSIEEHLQPGDEDE